MARLIDVWDVSTFDDALLSMLEDHAQLIRNYFAESVRLDREREAQSPRGPHKENRFGPALSAFRDAVTELMTERTIRAWHFTRLTAGERAIIREAGMQPMTLALIARRLDAAVAAGDLDRDLADHLYAESPFHHQIEGNRENKIWLTAQPYPLGDSGVEEFLDRWGGESIGFVHRDGAVLDRLQQVGSGCVLEIALPLRVTTRVGEAAQNVIDAFSRRSVSMAVGAAGPTSSRFGPSSLNGSSQSTARGTPRTTRSAAGIRPTSSRIRTNPSWATRVFSYNRGCGH